MSEKLEILKMIENGKITVEEGLEMIEAVELTERLDDEVRDEIYSKAETSGSFSGDRLTKETNQNTEEIYPQKAEKLINFDISLLSCKLNVERSQVEDVTIEIMDSKTREFISQPDWLRIVEEGNTISVKEVRMSDITSIFDFFKNGTAAIMPVMINIKIPREMSIDRAKFTNVSGITSLIGLKAIDIEVKSVSGKIHAADIIARTLQIKQTSGSMVIDNVRTANGILKSTSGKIKFTGDPVKLECKNVSGSIEVECGATNERVDVGAVSGKITIAVAEPESYNLNLSSVSGGIETNGFAIVDKSLPGNRKVLIENRSDYKRVNASVVSGKITFDKLN